MKKQFFIIASITLSFASAAQQVPQAVLNAFKSKYPYAVIKRLKQENDQYTARYKLAHEKHEAVFDAEGRWIKTTTVIRWKVLPEAIKMSFRSISYGWWVFDYAYKVDTPDGTTFILTLYKDEISEFAPTEYKEIFIAPSGEIIKVHKKS